MKSEQLFEALSEIDEKYIIEAKNEVITKKKKPYIKWIALASCIAVALVVAFGVTIINRPSKTPLVDSKTKSDVVSESIASPSVKDKSVYTTGKNNNSIDSTLVQTTTSENKTVKPKNQAETKGGDTDESIADERIYEDGGQYKVFKPGVDKFEPHDEMTLENRFCAFNYNGYSYYPAVDGEITRDDYETNKLTSVKASYWELRSANAEEETGGIVYYARIDIYKLKGVEPSNAVACVISFNGETKEYKYNAKKI